MTSKIEIAYGAVTFSGEGEDAWLATQLDKVLKLLEKAPPPARTETKDTTGNPGEFTTSLANYLKQKKATSAQVRKFLATADWLRMRGEPLSTTAVAKALSANQQGRLGNPSDCLNKNVGRGFCVKEGAGFYITPEGLIELGQEV